MINYANQLLKEFQTYKVYFYLALGIMILLYSLSFLLGNDLVYRVNKEDGLYENLTAIAFLLTAVFFLIYYTRTKKVVLLLFFVVFIFGSGEEISWGERIIGFTVPESIAENNAQHEFNLHNMKALSSFDENGIKQGISRYMTVTAMYLLFCFFYGIILPAFLMPIGFFRKIIERIHLPVPPLSLGIFFLINYIIFKSIGHAEVLDDPSVHFHSVVDETFELGSALIFLLISISFLQHFKKPQRKPAQAGITAQT